MLIDAAPARFFDDEHYKGYRAVLVRLSALDEEECLGLLWEAWRQCASKAMLKRFSGIAAAASGLRPDTSRSNEEAT
jgi:hypothetical protein